MDGHVLGQPAEERERAERDDERRDAQPFLVVVEDALDALAAVRSSRSGPSARSLRVVKSMAINRIQTGAIIIAGSGMCTGGRIVHHLKHNVARPECHVIFTGFQAAGTRGRALQEGARELKIHGQWIPIRAQVESLSSLSAHADADELLREVALRLGMDGQDQVRFATAVSEVARNAVRYAGGGRIEFGIETREGFQSLALDVIDRGPGISDLDAILEGPGLGELIDALIAEDEAKRLAALDS